MPLEGCASFGSRDEHTPLHECRARWWSTTTVQSGCQEKMHAVLQILQRASEARREGLTGYPQIRRENRNSPDYKGLIYTLGRLRFRSPAARDFDGTSDRRGTQPLDVSLFAR